MKRHVLMAVMLTAGVTACSSGNYANNANNEVTTSGVAQQWQLTMIDQQAISAEGSPTLNVNKDMEVNGYTGCNRYFGQAEIDNNRFKIDRMASTKMACAESSMALEQTMSQVLGQWSDASVRNNTLLLSNDTHTLVFTPANQSKATDDPSLKSPAVNSRFNKGEKY